MSINKVILIGNLGKDPETRYAASGTAVCNFQLATARKWKDKQGEQHEETEWHRISAFGRTAEVCGQYLKKGSQVYIEGRLKTSSYEKEGQKHFSTEVIVEQMQMLGKREGSQPGQAAQDVHNAFHGSHDVPPIPDSDVPF